MTDESRIRHSQAESAVVETDDLERAKKEAANGLRQAERVREYILGVLDGRPFRLRTSTILDLNRCAIDGLDAYAGNFRPGAVVINKSEHQPPEAFRVPAFVDDLCDYINDNWDTANAVHLASMVMWRLNRIHPFTDGNGRTSRAASYLVLCAHSQVLLAGSETIPEQIVGNRSPYYDALEGADRTYREEGKLSRNTVLAMEELMKAMLAKQLRSAFDTASGERGPAAPTT
jgi:Fic family protein